MAQTCDYYLEMAESELLAAEQSIPSLSAGLRAAMPGTLVCGSHYAKAYIAALLALTQGTRINQ